MSWMQAAIRSSQGAALGCDGGTNELESAVDCSVGAKKLGECGTWVEVENSFCALKARSKWCAANCAN